MQQTCLTVCRIYYLIRNDSICFDDSAYTYVLAVVVAVKLSLRQSRP